MDLSISDLRELLGCGKTHSFEIGKAYLIRTVTLYFTGRLEQVTDTDLKLSDAAWIPDTGRYADALLTGELGEVEPCPDDCIVSRGAIIDAVEWTHDLPRSQK